MQSRSYEKKILIRIPNFDLITRVTHDGNETLRYQYNQLYEMFYHVEKEQFIPSVHDVDKTTVITHAQTQRSWSHFL